MGSFTHPSHSQGLVDLALRHISAAPAQLHLTCVQSYQLYAQAPAWSIIGVTYKEKGRLNASQNLASAARREGASYGALPRGST